MRAEGREGMEGVDHVAKRARLDHDHPLGAQGREQRLGHRRGELPFRGGVERRNLTECPPFDNRRPCPTDQAGETMLSLILLAASTFGVIERGEGRLPADGRRAPRSRAVPARTGGVRL